MRLRLWMRWARHFGESRRLILVGVAFSILQAVLLMPVALIVRHVFDHVIPARDEGALLLSGAELLGVYVASTLLGFVNRYAVLKATKQAIGHLRIELLQKVYTLPRSYFDRKSIGELHSTIVQDSERLDLMSTSLVAVLLPATVIALALGAALAIVNAFLFLVMLAVLPVMLAIGRFVGRPVGKYYRAWQAAFEVFSTQAQLALRAVTVTRVSGAEQSELSRRRSEVFTLNDTSLQLAWRAAVYSLVQGSVAVSAGVVVLVVGGDAVTRGTMTLGELLSFYSLLALLLRQVNAAVAALPRITGGYESVARVEQFLAEDEPVPYRGTTPIEFSGGITLERVSFSYGGDPLLRDVSLEVAPGERIAIVGPNGAGKSTLLRLMLGLYRPGSGRLLADGKPYEEIDIRALRRRIGVLLQEPMIFPTTIRENIAYGRPEATDDEIRAAARWATADLFIQELGQGFDTLVGDEGSLLSGGERQRIALARALLARPALLILDEPSTHLDDASLERLLGNLRELSGAPAIVTITHDAEAAQIAGCVYHLRDGHIVSTLERDDGLVPVPLDLG